MSLHFYVSGGCDMNIVILILLRFIGSLKRMVGYGMANERSINGEKPCEPKPEEWKLRASNFTDQAGRT